MGAQVLGDLFFTTGNNLSLNSRLIRWVSRAIPDTDFGRWFMVTGTGKPVPVQTGGQEVVGKPSEAGSRCRPAARFP